MDPEEYEEYEDYEDYEDYEEHNIEDELSELFIQTRQKLLKYREENDLPLCEFLTDQVFSDFINFILNE